MSYRLLGTTVYKVANACDNVVDTKTHTRINHRKMSHVSYKKRFRCNSIKKNQDCVIVNSSQNTKTTSMDLTRLKVFQPTKATQF